MLPTHVHDLQRAAAWPGPAPDACMQRVHPATENAAGMTVTTAYPLQVYRKLSTVLCTASCRVLELAVERVTLGAGRNSSAHGRDHQCWGRFRSRASSTTARSGGLAHMWTTHGLCDRGVNRRSRPRTRWPVDVRPTVQRSRQASTNMQVQAHRRTVQSTQVRETQQRATSSSAPATNNIAQPFHAPMLCAHAVCQRSQACPSRYRFPSSSASHNW